MTYGTSIDGTNMMGADVQGNNDADPLGDKGASPRACRTAKHDTLLSTELNLFDDDPVQASTR